MSHRSPYPLETSWDNVGVPSEGAEPFISGIVAPNQSVIPPSQPCASEKPGVRHNLPRELPVNVAFVSGNRLPLQDYANIKSANRDSYGDRQNGQAASSEHATPATFYHTANPSPAEGTSSRISSDRRGVLPRTRRDPVARAVAPDAGAGDAGPFSADLTAAGLIRAAAFRDLLASIEEFWRASGPDRTYWRSRGAFLIREWRRTYKVPERAAFNAAVAASKRRAAA